LDFFGIGGRSIVFGGDAVLSDVFERLRVEAGSGDGTRK